MQNFSYNRREPLNVLIVAADFNLVQVGGKRLSALREDFYDQAAGAFTNNPQPIVCAYDIAMSGGEPYAVWN